MNRPVTKQVFDVNALRKDFPILSHPVYGKTLAYLDNAASAQKPVQVIDAMRRFTFEEYANVHRGVHYLSAAATERYESARETVRRFVNAESTDEIIFTKGGTEAINLVAASFLGPKIEAGDEIVLTVMEHHSNIVPWNFLRERSGAVLKWVGVADDGSLDMEAVVRAFSPRTKMLAITQMSNVLGTRTPLKEIIAAAHARGIPVIADGCQGAVHGVVDVRDLDVDFYALTGHKLYGPTGIGILYGKKSLLKTMRPYQGGGEMIREVTRERVTYADPPMRFEAGTPPIIQSVGLAAALDYMDGVGREAADKHEQELLSYATPKLQAIDRLKLFGTARDKGPILSFELEGIHAHDLATILDREGVAVRGGHHCAQVLMERFDTVGTARASFALYNTRDEVDALVNALHQARKVFG